MRVALVCDWFLPRMGGIELHLRDLALALRVAGVDARIVTTTRGEPVVDGVPVHRMRTPLAPGAGFAFTPGALRAVDRVIRGEGFDVVHAHASVVSPVAFAGAIAASRAGLPSLITFHSMLHHSAFLLGASEALFGWAGGRVVLSAVSSVVAEQAARWIPGASVGVLPNGMDTRFWRADPALRKPNEILFVSAMRLSRKKRPLRLVRAFAEAVRFVAGEPPMRLIMAGDGPERPRWYGSPPSWASPTGSSCQVSCHATRSATCMRVRTRSCCRASTSRSASRRSRRGRRAFR